MITVPGALEMPGAIALAAESGRYDGFVALGVVIRGETYHFEIVAGESARGLMALTMDGLAIGNGILTDRERGAGDLPRRPGPGEQGRAARPQAAMALLRPAGEVRMSAHRPIIPSAASAGASAATCSAGPPTRTPASRSSTDSTRPAGAWSTPRRAIRCGCRGHVGGESETVIGKWLEARGVRAEMLHRDQDRDVGASRATSRPAKVAEELDKSPRAPAHRLCRYLLRAPRRRARPARTRSPRASTRW